jgi:DNA polymerase-3 subunit alpha
VPLYRDPKSDMPATQFNMKWVEPAGLVKFDFLGLKTLTVLRRAVKLLIAQRGVEIDLGAIPLDDKKTYEMLGRGETVGVFQVESAGHAQGAGRHARRPVRGHHRAGRALSPGSDGEHPDLLRAQARRGEAEYLHPKLEPILKETFGVIIYQEQVMQIAQVLSGYSLGEADMLRRAMGKKIKAEMDAQRAVSSTAPTSAA